MTDSAAGANGLLASALPPEALAESLKGQLATRWLGRPRLEWHGSVGSTNDLVAELARDGAPYGTVVLAEAQTRGRGRQGRRWYSPPGANLYLSILLRPDLPAAAAPPLTLAAGVAVAEALASVGVRPQLKWPNDVLLGDKKVAGILTEMSSSGGRVEHVVMGLGVDVHDVELPPALASIATSVESALGAKVERVALLANLLLRLEAWMDVAAQSDGAARVAAGWRGWARFGQRVSVGEGPSAVRGVIESLDDTGALVLCSEDGRRHRVTSGEVQSVGSL